LIIRPEEGVVSIGARELPDPLTDKEFSVLYAVAKQRGRLIARSTVQKEVWGDEFSNPRTVDVFIFRVRTKLGALPRGRGEMAVGPNDGLVRTERGVGFGMGWRAFDSNELVMPRPRN
jgi:DNA-binding response OmpR family regulator